MSQCYHENHCPISLLEFLDDLFILRSVNYICENIPPDELEKLFLNNIDTAMGIFGLFVETGLDNAIDDTPARAFYLRLVCYIIKNETPELKQAFRETFNHFFPNLKPIGFNEKGDRLYSLDTLAEGLGVSMEELLSEAQQKHYKGIYNGFQIKRQTLSFRDETRNLEGDKKQTYHG